MTPPCSFCDRPAAAVVTFVQGQDRRGLTFEWEFWACAAHAATGTATTTQEPDDAFPVTWWWSPAQVQRRLDG